MTQQDIKDFLLIFLIGFFIILTFYIRNPVYAMELDIGLYKDLSYYVSIGCDALFSFIFQLLSFFEKGLQNFMLDYPAYALESPYSYFFQLLKILCSLLQFIFKNLKLICDLLIKQYGLLFTLLLFYVSIYFYKTRHKKF